MSLLKFDYSGCVHGDWGISQEEFAGCLSPLSEICNQIATGSIDLSFGQYPRLTLESYQQFRDDSELGEVFSIANRLHDDVDAVVVLGSGIGASVTQMLFKACCHPYHNELSRGGRGSKPRMYVYDCDTFDNDSAAALLQRVAMGGDGSGLAFRRWALVDATCDSKSETVSITRNLFRDALAGSLDHDSTILENFLFPAVGDAIGLGLLPAAIMGLECIQLLEGAAEIFEHLLTASPDENIVMHLAAVNQIMSRRARRPEIVAWSKALWGLGLWYNKFRGATSLDHEQKSAGIICHNLIVERCQMDPLRIINDGDEATRVVESTWPAVLTSKIRDAAEQHRRAGQPYTNFVIPEINTRMLGQLIQLLMLATFMESQSDAMAPKTGE